MPFFATLYLEDTSGTTSRRFFVDNTPSGGRAAQAKYYDVSALTPEQVQALVDRVEAEHGDGQQT